ncbi:MAG: hypothetical protein KDD22_05920 [Bdellovibrionales bacterium]|nr:hypothetical protein [Bdellovibrionales bacterium]
MDKLNWIRDLVNSEQQMEEAGIVDFSAGYNPHVELEEETIDFMNSLKTGFVEAASAFNQLRGSTTGSIKIYGISKTKADFMLFRNGHKLIFSIREPGTIKVDNNPVPTGLMLNANQQSESELLQAFWGAFGELRWTYQQQPINLDYLVRFYTTRFARESAK